MKLIKTIVKASRVEDVREVLRRLGIADLTVTELGEPRGPGRDAARPADDAGGSAAAISLMVLVVRDEIVAEVSRTITRAARTQAIGAGRVSVFPLEH